MDKQGAGDTGAPDNIESFIKIHVICFSYLCNINTIPE